MRRIFWILFASASVLFGQQLPDPPIKGLFLTGSGPGLGENLSSTPVQGAPYTASVVNETVQTLADGNRIVQSTTGTMARDSQGRTRQDMPLPAIGNMAAANAPHFVLIRDPLTQTAYTLNLTDKTAHKMPAPPPGLPGGAVVGRAITGSIQISDAIAGAAPGPMIQQVQIAGPVNADAGTTKTENLGSQTMEGVTAQGVRTTRTIPAGEVGNDQPITIVTEVWTSPDLKTVIYSKRSDPRIGDQTFRLKNIVRAEPDPSLFAIPSDFKMIEGPQSGNVIFYRRSQ